MIIDIIEILKAALLGLVQGITEWLPISSTGHMLLLDEFLKLQVSDAFMAMFVVVIQLGSALALLLYFFRMLNPFVPLKSVREKRQTIELWFKIIIASFPAGIIGLLFNDTIEAYLGGFVVIAIMLILYGIFFIIVENLNKNRRLSTNSTETISYKTAALMGAFQVLALIPGTSRSGSTILGGMILGCSRAVAAEFSFLMAIPVLFGASFLKLLKFGLKFSLNEWLILITGMAVAFIASLLTIKSLLDFIKKNSFKIFGYYRIVLGLIVLVFFIFKK